MSALPSAMTSTDAIAKDADDHVDPHNSANCTIDFVSSSMKPAPRKKKCHDQGDRDRITIGSGSDRDRIAIGSLAGALKGPRRRMRNVSQTAIAETANTSPSDRRK